MFVLAMEFTVGSDKGHLKCIMQQAVYFSLIPQV